MKWNSIRTKLIVFMLLPTILCIVTTMIVSYNHTTQSLRTRAVEENTDLLYQGFRNINSLLSELNRISLTVYSDSDFYRLLEGGYDDMSSNIEIYSSLNYIASSMPDIFQVYLYGVKDNKATLFTQNISRRWQGVPAYEDSNITGNLPLAVQSTHVSHNYGLTSPLPQATTEQVFTLHRRIERIPSNQALGFLSIDVKLSALTEIVEQLYDQNQEDLFLLDNQGNVVYADQPDIIGDKLQAEWYDKQILHAEQKQGYFEMNHAVFIYQRILGNGADWTLVKQIPVPYLLREANEAVKINLLLLALSLIIITTAIILISIKITAPIKQLSRYMNQIESGNLHVNIVPAGKDEIGIVTQRFRSMMDTINNLILKEYKLELSNKTNQLRALQAQINPHFLNNTLQIIGTLALELKVPQIYSLLSALAKIMHYSMHNNDQTVTLQNELDHVKAYVELQKERFENKFSFRYDVEESILQVPMPKMILQPIVENYFKHGFRGTSDGWIELNAKHLPGDRVEICIQNNGVGIPLTKLESLRAELNSSDLMDINPIEDKESLRESPGLKIGLRNVLTRLQLVCGDNASLDIDNLEAGGIMIRLEFDFRSGA